MDEMWMSVEEKKDWKIQCKLFRISVNPTDEKVDLEKMNEFLAQNEVISMMSQYVTSKNDYWHVMVLFRNNSNEVFKENVTCAVAQENDKISESDAIDQGLVEKLKEWRREEAYKRGWPAYRILTNGSIDELSKRKTTIIAQLHSIKGIGPATEEAFGTDIINIITNHIQESKR
jgi:superfamily II DNA helicase RecQ